MPNRNRVLFTTNYDAFLLHQLKLQGGVEELEAEPPALETLETTVAEDKNVTTLFASGLARVETLQEEGVVRLVFFETRREMTNTGVEDVHRPTFNVIMPVEAADPASGLLQRAWRRLRGLAASARQQLLN